MQLRAVEKRKTKKEGQKMEKMILSESKVGKHLILCLLFCVNQRPYLLSEGEYTFGDAALISRIF